MACPAKQPGERGDTIAKRFSSFVYRVKEWVVGRKQIV